MGVGTTLMILNPKPAPRGSGGFLAAGLGALALGALNKAGGAVAGVAAKAAGMGLGNPADSKGFKLRKGQLVYPLAAVKGYYSGYGGRPEFYFEPGMTGKVVDPDVPTVHGPRKSFVLVEFQSPVTGQVERASLYPENVRVVRPFHLKGNPRRPACEKVLWGVMKGDKDWQEVVLSIDPRRFEQVKKMAAEAGFHKFRVATIDLGKPPDFTKTLIHNPRRPTREFMRRCVKGVGPGYDPGAVCASAWHKMGAAARRKWLAGENPERLYRGKKFFVWQVHKGFWAYRPEGSHSDCPYGTARTRNDAIRFSKRYIDWRLAGPGSLPPGRENPSGPKCFVCGQPVNKRRSGHAYFYMGHRKVYMHLACDPEGRHQDKLMAAWEKKHPGNPGKPDMSATSAYAAWLNAFLDASLDASLTGKGIRKLTAQARQKLMSYPGLTEEIAKALDREARGRTIFPEARQQVIRLYRAAAELRGQVFHPSAMKGPPMGNPRRSPGLYWVRLGDAGEYVDFEEVRDALEYIYKATGDREYYKVKGGLVFPGLYEGLNCVSLYYGDAQAEWIRDLIPSELGVTRYKPNPGPAWHRRALNLAQADFLAAKRTGVVSKQHYWRGRVDAEDEALAAGGNPGPAWHRRQRAEYGRRLAGDLAAGHRDAADYWQGAASAEGRAMAAEQVNPVGHGMILYARREPTTDPLLAGKPLRYPYHYDVVLYMDRQARHFYARWPWDQHKPTRSWKYVNMAGARFHLTWIPDVLSGHVNPNRVEGARIPRLPNDPAESYRRFHGLRVKGGRQVMVPEGWPRKLWHFGKLVELNIEPGGARIIGGTLAGCPRNNSLFIIGGSPKWKAGLGGNVVEIQYTVPRRSHREAATYTHSFDNPPRLRSLGGGFYVVTGAGLKLTPAGIVG